MTTALSISKQQRLRTLEKNIRDEAAKIQSSGLAIGQYLMEIRDDHLWKDDFESWNQYLKERAGELVGKSFLQAARLISAAEIAKRLPSSFIDETTVTATHLSELGRLAPNSGKNTSGGGYVPEDVHRSLLIGEEFFSLPLSPPVADCGIDEKD
jgi:hypothetical protein